MWSQKNTISMSELQFTGQSTKGYFDLEQTVGEYDYIVLLFQRDYLCTNCRSQVQDVEERYNEFLELDTQVVSILPGNISRAEKWDEKYNL